MARMDIAVPTVQLLDLPVAELRRIVETALAEDVGSGDITTDNLVPAETMAHAGVVYRTDGVVCGTQVLATVFRTIDERVVVDVHWPEGAHVSRGTKVATARGSARSILKGERVALNFMQRMGAIATATA